MKYDLYTIDTKIEEAADLIYHGKPEKAQVYILMSIAMMMRNTLDNEIIEVFTDPRPSDGYR